MSNQTLHVLHVEDDFADAMLVQHAVCEAGDFDISFEVVRTLREAKLRMQSGGFDLILLDLRLPDSVHPTETLEAARSHAGSTPVLVLSGSMTIDRDHLGEDIASLDKNASFKAVRGVLPVNLAHLIRGAAEAADFQAI
jgi:CheY-like chemotaxis protein|tara:strand:- start:17820 stop:18236 length:417 start_codon:yes stop_codon:yes gene_type:complete